MKCATLEGTKLHDSGRKERKEVGRKNRGSVQCLACVPADQPGKGNVLKFTVPVELVVPAFSRMAATHAGEAEEVEEDRRRAHTDTPEPKRRDEPPSTSPPTFTCSARDSNNLTAE